MVMDDMKNPDRGNEDTTSNPNTTEAVTEEGSLASHTISQPSQGVIGPELQEQILQIYTLCEGLQNLALHYVASKDSYEAQVDAAAEMELYLEEDLNHIVSDWFGGVCGLGMHRCNGICTYRPCYKSGGTTGGSEENSSALSDRLLRIYSLCEGIQNLALHHVASQDSYDRRVAAGAEIKFYIQEDSEQILSDKFGGDCGLGMHSCNGICTYRPCYW
jgi:hypothetical protein